MMLDTFRPTDKAFSNHMRFVEPIGNGVTRLRPNGFMVCYEFRGPDTLGVSWEDLTARANRLAGVMAQLDSNWCFHVEVQRVRGAMYPRDGAWPDVVTYLLDSARRQRYEGDGEHYLSVGRLWISWYPQERRNSVLDFLYNDHDNIATSVEKFEKLVWQLQGALKPYFLEFRRLALRDHQLLTGERVMADDVASALLRVVHGKGGVIAGDPSMGMRYDTLVAPSWVDLKPDLILDGRHIGVVSFFGYPQFVAPSMMDGLRGLPVDMRYVVRIVPYSLPEAESRLHNKAAIHLLTSLGLGLFLKKGEDDGSDETATAWRAQVHASRDEAKRGVPYAQVNPKVVIYGDSAQAVRDVELAISGELERMGVKPRIEDASNRFQAYCASLPGEIDADEVLAPPLPVAGALRLAPITSLWHGPERHPDKRYGPNAGPILMMTTPMLEPFRLFLHVGEVGHTLILGRTGRGKSVLLRALEVGHLSRYPGGRILGFDVGRSAYKLVKSIGGRHYMPHLGKVPQVAYLSGLDDPAQFEAVENRVLLLLELWLDRRITIHEIEDVNSALKAVAGLRKFRLSDVGRTTQGIEIRAVFDKLKDSMLDAYADDFDFGSGGTPYWCFEVGLLGVDQHRWTVPFITYVQDRAFEEFAKHGTFPTWVPMDEGARILKVPRVDQFAERVEREGRKSRAQFCFATQSADEIVKSTIASVLIEQTVSKFLFANRQLSRKNKKIREQYLEIGYTEDALDVASELGEYDVLFMNEYGMQVIALAPLSIELALYGGASEDDCNVVDRLIKEHGKNFVSAYLRSRRDLVGCGEFADALDTLRSAWSARELALEVAV
jgi:type IV secretory pathway VirB4 component